MSCASIMSNVDQSRFRLLGCTRCATCGRQMRHPVANQPNGCSRAFSDACGAELLTILSRKECPRHPGQAGQLPLTPSNKRISQADRPSELKLIRVRVAQVKTSHSGVPKGLQRLSLLRMLFPPLRAGTAHVMLLWPISTRNQARHFTTQQ